MKISIIGAGNVGGMTAMSIAREQLGDVVLIDVAPGLAKGKAFDLDDARQIVNSHYLLEGTEDLSALERSGIIVVTAGLARKPGMTREDLLFKNADILSGICQVIRQKAASALVIVVTNPLDVMTYYALKQLNAGPQRVFGMGVTLDGSRFANLIAQELKIKPHQIQPCVIGSHGESMVPLPRFTMVDGEPLTARIKDPQKIASLVARTVQRGKEIVSLLGSGSAYFAPAAAITQLVKAVVRNERLPLGVSALVNGEYGLSDICIGVPAIIGADGVENIVELKLDIEEKSALIRSAESI